METSRGHECVAYTLQNVAYLSDWYTQCHILLSFGYCNCTSKMRPLSCVHAACCKREFVASTPFAGVVTKVSLVVAREHYKGTPLPGAL